MYDCIARACGSEILRPCQLLERDWQLPSTLGGGTGWPTCNADPERRRCWAGYLDPVPFAVFAVQHLSNR
jgi:hypothetical protein